MDNNPVYFHCKENYFLHKHGKQTATGLDNCMALSSAEIGGQSKETVTFTM